MPVHETPALADGKLITNALGQIVDNDAKFRWSLHSTLHTLGFEIMESSNGEEALKEVKNRRFDAVLQDINMPGMGEIETCRELRQFSPGLQILILTVRESVEDKVEALEAGADVTLQSPSSYRNWWRLKAAVRRASTSPPETGKAIVVGDIGFDPERRIVRKEHKVLHLTPKEFDLLHYLMAHAGLPIPRQTLARRLGPRARARTGILAHLHPPTTVKTGRRSSLSAILAHGSLAWLPL